MSSVKFLGKKLYQKFIDLFKTINEYFLILQIISTFENIKHIELLEKDLGIIISRDLNLSDQSNKAASNANRIGIDEEKF